MKIKNPMLVATDIDKSVILLRRIRGDSEWLEFTTRQAYYRGRGKYEDGL